MKYATDHHYYEVKEAYGGSNKVRRISCDEYESGPLPPKPNVGDKVMVVIKPYYQNNCAIGIIKRVLTKKKRHTRGHKVMLSDGTVGRIKKNFGLAHMRME